MQDLPVFLTFDVICRKTQAPCYCRLEPFVPSNITHTLHLHLTSQSEYFCDYYSYYDDGGDIWFFDT